MAKETVGTEFWEKNISESVSLYAVNSHFICSYITSSDYSIILLENVWMTCKAIFIYSKDFSFNLTDDLTTYAIYNMLGNTVLSS